MNELAARVEKGRLLAWRIAAARLTGCLVETRAYAGWARSESCCDGSGSLDLTALQAFS